MPALTYLSFTDIFERKIGEALDPTSSMPMAVGMHGPPPLPPVAPHFFPMPGGGPHGSSTHVQTETFTDTLLSFRFVPADCAAAAECFVGGCFGANEVVLKGMWVEKAELKYTFVRHANVKGKKEYRWDRERVREFGPPGNDFDGF